jgi:hypothetical protein
MIRQGKIVDAKTALCYFLSAAAFQSDIPF